MSNIQNAIHRLEIDYAQSDPTAHYMLCTRFALSDILNLIKQHPSWINEEQQENDKHSKEK